MSGRERTRNGHCQQESYGRPDCGKKYATSNHQSEDISFPRAECYSQSNLLSPLLHHMRDYAVDTDGSEAQGQGRKRAEKAAQQAITGTLSVEHSPHCVDSANRLVLVHSPNGLPHGRRKSGGVPAPQHHHHEPHRGGGKGECHLGPPPPLSHTPAAGRRTSPHLPRACTAQNTL